MDVIWIMGAAILGIFSAAFAKILADDFKAWRPRLVDRLINYALAKLPECHRQRFDEEWRSHVNDVPGEIGKITTAIGYRWAAAEITSQHTYGRGLKFAATKRVQDIVIATSALLCLAPLAVIICVAVKLASPGPILLRHRRLGLNGKLICLYRLRTMFCPVSNYTEGGQVITRLGRFLLRYYMDELPLILNVLFGDLSIVGPAAPLADDQLTIADDETGYNMKPGLVSWWHLNGAIEHSSTEAERRLRRLRDDAYYANNWSLWLDLRILARTAISALFRRTKL